MQKLIRNDWIRKSGEPCLRAEILKHEIHPEGLDVERIRFSESGSLALHDEVGHIISIFQGNGRLYLHGDHKHPLNVQAGVHAYIPPGSECLLEAEPETECICISSPSSSQARGKKLLLRDETYLAACASDSQSLRWILTPQYLSRRIFLYHDQTLLSKAGNPVSLFHTTMFDVSGLPKNADGESVFKMSYNSRTEVNFCYDVKGTARVRMAQHPYRSSGQIWNPWLTLDSDSTYHLNEIAGGPEEESIMDTGTQTPATLRNRHEVLILDGYVSLFCVFDPAPTGIERHRPGEYTDYEPLSEVIKTKSYEIFSNEIALFDEMLDVLSMAHAANNLDEFKNNHVWSLYLQGREAQIAIESKLVDSLVREGKGREQVLARWLTSRDSSR